MSQKIIFMIIIFAFTVGSCFQSIVPDSRKSFELKKECVGNIRTYIKNEENKESIYNEIVISKTDKENNIEYELLFTSFNGKKFYNHKYLKRCVNNKDFGWCEINNGVINIISKAKINDSFYSVYSFDNHILEEFGKVNDNSYNIYGKVDNEKAVTLYEIKGIYKIDELSCYKIIEEYITSKYSVYDITTKWYCDKLGLIAEFSEFKMEEKLFKAQICGIDYNEEKIDKIVSAVEWNWTKELVRELILIFKNAQKGARYELKKELKM